MKIPYTQLIHTSNLIELEKENGDKISGQNEIKEEIKIFFENLYKEENDHDAAIIAQLGEEIPKLIFEENNESLA